jgi:hypothetical protein
MRTSFSILVNSTDSYEDCWLPFFKLFKVYWPDCKHQIWLNTEYKDFSFPGLNVKALQSAKALGKEKPTWSESFLHAFDTIESDIILYLQEDYFFKGAVQQEKVKKLVDLMYEHELTYVGLTDFGNIGPFQPSFHPDLWQVDQNDAYRISLQASLFNKHGMRKYVRKHENPWQFEFFGNKRARRTADSFFTVNRDLYSLQNNAIIPYEPTGIISGQWEQAVVEKLFAEHGIEMDYSRRGFFQPDPNKRRVRKPITVDNILSRVKSLLP